MLSLSLLRRKRLDALADDLRQETQKVRSANDRELQQVTGHAHVITKTVFLLFMHMTYAQEVYDTINQLVLQHGHIWPSPCLAFASADKKISTLIFQTLPQNR